MAYARKRNNSTLEARMAALKADFEELQKDTRKLFENLGDAASTGVSEATGNATKAAMHAAEEVEHWAENGVDAVRSAIREQPLTAIAISMGAGAIIGSMLRR
jgi:ElaB/YqjD/DUF883 family membrane-anchored ribosome-binding protein